MSNNLWTEIFLLKRYKLIQFVVYNPSFCNYLKKLYILYKKDLRHDFILLPIEHKVELDVQKELTEMFKSFVLIDVTFMRRYEKLLKIFSNWPPKYNGKGSFFKWMTNMKLKNQKKFVQYTKIFEQISDHIFHRYVKLGLPISTLDKIILSLEIETPVRFFIIAAFFRFILYQYSQNEKNIILPDIKKPKIKCKRVSV